MKKYSNLNIGCGYAPIENWLNIGLFGERDIPYGFIRKRNNCDVLHFDVKARLPIKNESVKYIFAAHFIEHLRYNNGILVLKLMFNYLEKGGVLRITFPDLQIWAANYYLNNSSFFEEYRTKYLKHETMIKTNAEIFMSQVHGHGHLWGYDFESMKHFLEMIGFMDVQKKKISESSIPGIEEIEKAAVIRDFETCYVEALKP
jgi:predicted SAM-dependent methyltransferase